MQTNPEHISNLTIEIEEDGSVVLEQDCTGNISRVWVHPVQLRYIAEKMGLVETSDPKAAKTIATLERRLLVLRDRIDELHDYLVNHSDHKHADLSYEVTFSRASLDIVEEFCHDLDEQPDNTARDATPSAPCTAPSAAAGDH